MKLREDLVLRHIGADHVIVDPGQEVVDMSKVFTLNDSAAWLWEQLQGRTFSKETMVDLLLSAYEVTAELAAHDADQLISLFERHGLLNQDLND
jgi:hypothetical protein